MVVLNEYFLLIIVKFFYVYVILFNFIYYKVIVLDGWLIDVVDLFIKIKVIKYNWKIID